MSNRLPFILILLAVVAYLAYNSVYVVHERGQAIVVRFGEIQDVKSEPGLYFKLPFAFAGADNVMIVEDRLLRFDLDDIRVQVADGKFYEVDAFVVYRVSDPRTFRQTVSGDIEVAEQRLRTRLDAALRRVYGLRGFEAALSEERAEMMQEVGDQLRPAAESLGLKVVDVRIRRTDLTDEVSQQTFARMQAERLAEAERLRARGREAAQRIRAIANRQAVEILADARREAEILRGQGDALRSAIYADAYSRDPEFFEFYRSMNAYQQALDESGTTMVLSPNSEFFSYFRDPDGFVAPRLRDEPAQPSAGTAEDAGPQASGEAGGTSAPEAGDPPLADPASQAETTGSTEAAEQPIEAETGEIASDGGVDETPVDGAAAPAADVPAEQTAPAQADN